MLRWLKSLLKVPEPSGPPHLIRAFQTANLTISQGCIAVEQDGWVVDSQGKQTLRLFEVPVPGLEDA